MNCSYFLILICFYLKADSLTDDKKIRFELWNFKFIEFDFLNLDLDLIFKLKKINLN